MEKNTHYSSLLAKKGGLVRIATVVGAIIFLWFSIDLTISIIDAAAKGSFGIRMNLPVAIIYLVFGYLLSILSVVAFVRSFKSGS